MEFSGGYFDVDQNIKLVESLDVETARPGFWGDNESAQKILQKRSGLQRSIEIWENLEKEREDLEAMLDLFSEEEDSSIEKEIRSSLTQLCEQLAQAELKAMLSGRTDFNNAFVAINSGAGGTESQDWAEMLLRMYLRWGDRNGYKTEVLDTQYGEEAGIKSATILFSGDYVFGYLKAEIGVHRLVPVSYTHLTLPTILRV